MRNRNGELNVSHPFPTDLLLGNLDAASVTDNSAVLDSLVLAAVALVILGRTENLLTEKTVPLRLVGPVIDRLRLEDLSRRPFLDVFRRSKSDADSFEIAFNLVIFIKSRHISKISNHP